MKKTILPILIGLLIVLLPTVYLFAQDEENSEESTGAGRYGEDSITCITNISLYREFFKQWKASNYQNDVVKDAINPWRWVFLNCPRGTQNTYIDGVKIMSYRIDKEKDPAKKNLLIDTLMMLYDQRIQYFGKEGYVLGRKGVDLYNFRPENYEAVFNTLKKSVELQGNKSAGPVLVYYFRSAISMAKDGKADTSLIFDTYDIISNILDYDIKKYKDNPKELANWQVIQGNIEMTMEPYATCNQIVTIYRKKFTENPDDADLLRKIVVTMDKKKCQEDPLYFDVIKKLYGLDPSPESAYLLGKMMMNKEKYPEAIEYLKAAENSKDTELVDRSYKYIAESYRAQKNYPAARTYVLKAIALNPHDGEAYIMIGDMYVASAKDCGDNDLTKRVAYWAAIDKYKKAKQVDPSVAEMADKRIADYSIYFPTQETIFFNNLKEGETYKVGCWINEETTVRAAKQ